MPISCPRCFSPLLTKTQEDIEVEYCMDCEGLLLDCTELDAIVEEMAGSVEYSISQNREHTSQDPFALLQCPKCDIAPSMQRIRFIGYDSIYLDRCPQCSLLWLDKNELANINQNIRHLKSSTAQWPFWMKIRFWASHIVT